MWAECMVGVWLCFTFVLPVLLAYAIYQVNPDAVWTKITALLLGPSLFMACWAIYGYFSLRLAEGQPRQTTEGET